MTLLKRITTSVRAQVEHLVDQIENQDALVESAIREMKQANARARARLKRVQQDRSELERKLCDLRTSEEQWQQRAIANAEKDETTALECLARRNQCRERITGLRTALEQQIEEHSQLEARIAQADEQVASLSRRRNIMRGRESNAEVQHMVEQWQSSGPADLETLFERWEGRIIETGIPLEAGNRDPLEQRFLQSEQESALRAELHSLCNQEKDHE